MGSITAKSIIDSALGTLHDPNSSRWTQNEMLGWLNTAQRAVASLRPEAAVTTTVIPLVAGPRQTLPVGTLSLVKLTRNMGVSGTATGRAIRAMDEDSMDGFDPNWMAAAPDGVVVGFVYDHRNPKEFYVYPPQPAAVQKVEAVLSVSPTDIATVDGTITVDDIFEPALEAFILFRAYGKDSKVGDITKAGFYFNAFLNILGVTAANADRVKSTMKKVG